MKFVFTGATGLLGGATARYLKNQGHNVIGVDIKQDYLPKLKGLVTVNSKSTYTNVAQAIFRFRKLNRGTIMTTCILYKDSPQIGDINLAANITYTSVYSILKGFKASVYKTLLVVTTT